jgi:glutamate-5-semialdehyde dehydrogenase
VLKARSAAVLRTGSAALGSARALVDLVIAPALEKHGVPAAAVQLVPTPGHAGAEALVGLPDLVPLVVVRGSGEVTRKLSALGAAAGTRVLAHADGGGVLYLDSSAADADVTRLVTESTDRLGVCNRLNLALVDRAAVALLPALVRALAEHGLELRATDRAREHVDGLPLDRRIGHEWASDTERVATVTLDLVDGLDEALSLANDETSGLAAAVVTEDPAEAARFLDGYRGTAAFWNATTRLTDGFKLTGTPETGINVERAPGPRGPVTYRDLWLRQYRVVPE